MEPHKIIYLQGVVEFDHPEKFVTWCQTRVDESDIEYIRKDIFGEVCKHIAIESESCPADSLLGWDRPGGCALVCKNQAAECWGLYYISKAAETIGLGSPG